MFQRGLTPPNPFRERSLFETVQNQDGLSLAAMLELGRVLVVCLPRLPARKWLARVAAARPGIEAEGTRLLLVTMEVEAVEALAPHGLEYVARTIDPERRLYAHFGLGETRRLGLFGAEQQPGTALLEGESVVRVELTPP